MLDALTPRTRNGEQQHSLEQRVVTTSAIAGHGKTWGGGWGVTEGGGSGPAPTNDYLSGGMLSSSFLCALARQVNECLRGTRQTAIRTIDQTQSAPEIHALNFDEFGLA